MKSYFSIIFKPLLTLLLIFFYTQGMLCQNYPCLKESMSLETFQQIEKAVNLYWAWEKDEDPKQAVNQLEMIAKQHPKNWVAPYWAAYIATQISNSIKGEAGYLDKAQTLFNQAENAFNNQQDSLTYSYFPALQCLIYRLKSFQPIEDKEKTALREKAKGSLKEGYQYDPTNPILWVLTATSPNLDYANNIGNRLAGAALLQKAKNVFAAMENKKTIDISYWNAHWVEPWLNNLVPSKVKVMEPKFISNE